MIGRIDTTYPVARTHPPGFLGLTQGAGARPIKPRTLLWRP